VNEPITYVGIHAHKRELHVAMLVGQATPPVTWKMTKEAGCGVRSSRRRWCRGSPASGSRPTAGMRAGWPSCAARAS